MAKMMLDLMEVMGFIHRVPDSAGGYGPSAFSGWNPLGMYSGLSNPMLMYQGAGMASQVPGMFPSPGGWSGQPFSMPGRASIAPGQQRIALSVDELQRLLESRPPLPVADSATPIVPQATLPNNPALRVPEAAKAAVPGETPAQNQFEGVWLGTRNDLLRISGSSFVWTAADGSTLDGSFYLDDGIMVVQTRQSETPARYVVQFSPDSFIALDEAGHRYEFVRPLSSRQATP